PDQLAHAERRIDRGLAVGLGGDVALDELRVGAELRGMLVAELVLDVCDDDLAAGPDDQLGGRAAEAGCAAGDDDHVVLEFHGLSPLRIRTACPARRAMPRMARAVPPTAAAR